MSRAEMKTLLNHIANQHTLSSEQARSAFEIIMSGMATPAQIGAFLMGLRQRGETVEEITAAATILRAKAQTINAPKDAMDIVGTGGDGLSTFNISTATAIVVAGCGVPVAKHGNRAASSQTGFIDILQVLGVNLDAPFAVIERAIIEAGMGFLMAPRHHTAMRHVGDARKEMGVRTIFNILGPLINPAFVKYYLIGAFSKVWLRPMAECLHNLGATSCWCVHGDQGLDELSITGENTVVALKDGHIIEFTILPEDAGLARAPLDAILGGDPQTNAHALRDLLAGTASAYRDTVLLNAAAALIIRGLYDDLKQAVQHAAHAIDSGKAQTVLDKLVQITQESAHV